MHQEQTPGRGPVVPTAHFGRTSAAYFCHFLVSGLMGPFIATILTGLGYSHAQLAMVLAAGSLWTIVMPYFVGRVSEQRGVELMVRVSGAATFLLSLVLWSQHAAAKAFVAVLLAFYGARAPMGSLLDTLAMRAAGRQAGRYSRIRLLGSLGFMVAACASGWLLASDAEARFFPTLVILSGIAMTAGLLLPRGPRLTAVAQRAGDRALGAHLRKPFWLWLAAMMLHWLTFAPYQYGFTLLLAEQHVPTAYVGVMWSIGVATEIATFFGCAWLFRRVSVYRVMLAAMATAMVRWGLLGLFPSPWMIAFTQLLHGPSFALYCAAAMQMLSEFTPAGMQSSMQGLFATCVNGMAYCVGTLLAATLHNTMPLHHVMLVMLPAEAAAMGLMVMSQRARHSQSEPRVLQVQPAALPSTGIIAARVRAG